MKFKNVVKSLNKDRKGAFKKRNRIGNTMIAYVDSGYIQIDVYDRFGDYVKPNIIGGGFNGNISLDSTDWEKIDGHIPKGFDSYYLGLFKGEEEQDEKKELDMLVKVLEYLFKGDEKNE